jgi:hypothetical protein
LKKDFVGAQGWTTLAEKLAEEENLVSVEKTQTKIVER